MEFEVGQKWQTAFGGIREIVAVGPEAVAYRMLSGGTVGSLVAGSLEDLRGRGWTLIHPKPIPEGWTRNEAGNLTFTASGGRQTGVIRRWYRGDGPKVGIACRNGGAWMDPEGLKAAIDFVMDADD